jgi:hypothetical protein
LTRALSRGRQMPYRRGVSLIALIERLPGDAPVRTRPPDVGPDRAVRPEAPAAASRP